MRFKNRIDAGQQLAQKLQKYRNDPQTIILGLPRGGVETAAAIAQALNLPLDILVSRKLGFPLQPELAIGALSEDGQLFLNKELITSSDISPADLQPIIDQEKKEAARRAATYRAGKPRLNLKNKIVILVDDGIATGATMHVSIQSARTQGAQKIIVAAPVTPTDAYRALKKEADEIVVLDTPDFFPGVSAFYDSFSQLTDEQVLALLAGRAL